MAVTSNKSSAEKVRAHRERLRARPLFKQLDIRTRLARLAYSLKSPWLIRLGWQVTGWGVRFTRWGDPDYVPDETPQFHLTDLARST